MQIRLSNNIRKDLLLLIWFLSLRSWESLSSASCCRSLVIVYRGNCLLQIGVAAKSSEEGSDAAAIDVPKLMQGSLYRSAMESRKRMFLIMSFRYVQLETPCLLKLNCELNIWSLFFSAESYLANLSLYPGKSELPFLPVDTQVFIVINLDRFVLLITLKMQ